MQTPDDSSAVDSPEEPGFISRTFATYDRIPLYLRIVGGLVLGVIVGLSLYSAGGGKVPWVAGTATVFDKIAKMVIQFLAALAPPLILLAVIRALMSAKIEGRQGKYMVRLLVLNTLVAILIGLAVANAIQPGSFAAERPTAPLTTSSTLPSTLPAVVPSTAPASQPVAHTQPVQVATASKPLPDPKNIIDQLLDNIPSNLVKPLSEGKVISVVILALVFGIAARRLVDSRRQLVSEIVESGFAMILIVLHWVIWLVPIAVFAKVASIIGTEGFDRFMALGAFVLAVILALLLQASYYLFRIRWKSWVRPTVLIRQTRDALVMAFSTASSTATMPVTYELLRNSVGLRERSASLGALVGSNFNNDGTALYEAMAALFIAQLIGIELTLTQQVMVVLTSVIASVGAAGIPEAGLVTMTLVFTAVNLPTEYIPFLLPIDWFLDRCRTAINVMGDMNVACLLDGKEKEASPGPEPVPAEPVSV